MSYLKTSAQCGNDCIVTSVDTEDCLSDLVRCVRTAEVCSGCTCLDLGLVVNEVKDNPFNWCYCSDAPDHKSIDPTAVVKKFSLAWPGDSLVTDIGLAALAAIVCEEPEANVIWKFFAQATPQACPISTVDWSPTLVSLDGGTTWVTEVAEPAPGTVFTLYSGPGLHEGFDDIYDCTGVPGAYLLQIRTTCGSLLVLCPEPASTGDQVYCPPVPRCCQLSLGVIFSDGCIAGVAAIHFNIISLAPITCTGGYTTYTIYAKKAGVIVDTLTVSDTTCTTSINASTLHVPCDGSEGEMAYLLLDSNNTCAGCDATPDLTSICYYVYLDGSGFGPIDCGLVP